MKVYAVVSNDSDEIHVHGVYTNQKDAKAEAYELNLESGDMDCLVYETDLIDDNK